MILSELIMFSFIQRSFITYTHIQVHVFQSVISSFMFFAVSVNLQYQWYIYRVTEVFSQRQNMHVKRLGLQSSLNYCS